MRHENFAVLILSHGRADNMKTLETLTSHGYKGRWYIVIDNEDDTADECYARFGKDHVVMFDKAEAAKKIDIGDNLPGRNVVVIARNMCHEIAKTSASIISSSLTMIILRLQYDISKGISSWARKSLILRWYSTVCLTFLTKAEL